MNNSTDTLLFYDIEVFATQSCVVFLHTDGTIARIFTDNLDGLGEYIDEGAIKGTGYTGLKDFLHGKTLVGYNNYHYDDWILNVMIRFAGHDDQAGIIKAWNDSIINAHSYVNMAPINESALHCKTIDAYQQIDVSRPSLKKIEGNMGHSIIESSVSFDTTDPLTPEENLEVVRYCINDVKETIAVYGMRGDYFASKETILKMLPKETRERARKWNTTSIVGHLLRPKHGAKHKRAVSDAMLERVPMDVAEMWRQIDVDYRTLNTKKVVVEEHGVKIEFGFGGLHGAPDRFVDVRNVKLADVNSMYPSIIILLNGLGNKTEMYDGIRKKRIAIKHSGGNPGLSAAYKLILNSTYGILNYEHSQIYNPWLSYSVSIYGQIALYDLFGRLVKAGCRPINLNTDGITFIPDDAEEYMTVKADWEQEFGLSLDIDDFKRWVQKDVNNYIAIKPDDTVKVKGGDVNKYNGGSFVRNNDIRITHMALVDKLLYGTSPADTIKKNLGDPILFQYILQAGKTYQGTYDNKGNKLNNINRVFAGKDTGYELCKVRQDGGRVKFADAPDDMILFNGDLRDIDLAKFKKELNKQWYYDLAIKRLQGWR